MLDKQFDLIDENDIKRLIRYQVPENKTLEYKEKLPKNDEHSEFLKDVSAFANASGGILIYGIQERKRDGNQSTSLPEKIVGLGDINSDHEKRRWLDIIKNGISPRINVEIGTIHCDPSGIVLIIRVAQSWNAPHMVTYRGAQKFFSRNNAGKYPLDIDEIKAKVIASESLQDKIREFRVDRVAKLIADESPMKIESNTKFMLHLIPLSSFGLAESIDIRSISIDKVPFPFPIDNGQSRVLDDRFNLDGFLISRLQHSYVQIFRSGIIEIAGELSALQQESKIRGLYFQKIIVKGLSEYLDFFKQKNINPPIIVFVSCTGVKGYKILLNEGSNSPHIIDRDMLILPDVILEDYSVSLKDQMRLPFHVFWQAAGYKGSPSYNDEGKWID